MRQRTIARIALSAAVLATSLGPIASPSALAADNDVPVVRMAGPDRFATAALVAAASLADGLHRPQGVILARGNAFPDALAGSYLAGQVDAPLVLTSQAAMPEATEAVLATARDVYVLGGTAAIPDEVLAGLPPTVTITRLAGSTRYETAAAIATMHRVTPVTRVLVASGTNFPDALVAGVVSAGAGVPLLLTAPSALPEATSAALQQIGATEAFIVGGAAAVSSGVEEEIAALGIATTRLAGPSRYETATAVADWAMATFDWAFDGIALASGQNFPDALAMAPRAGLHLGGSRPLVLTSRDALPAASATWLAAQASCQLTALEVAGGPAAVSDVVAAQVQAALTPASGCANDTGGPAITLDTTTPVEIVGGYATLRGTASDPSGVASITIHHDGEPVVASTREVTGTSIAWESISSPPEGLQTFEIVATDRLGNVTRLERQLDFALARHEDGSATAANVYVATDDGLVYDPDTASLTFPAAVADEAIPGWTVASGVTTANPNGYLVRILTAEPGPNGTVIATVAQAALMDVFHSMKLDVETPVGDPPAPSSSPDREASSSREAAGGVFIPLPLDVTQSFKLTYGANSLDLSLAAAGSLHLVVGVQIDVEWSREHWFAQPKPELQKFSVSTNGGYDITTSITVRGTVGNDAKASKTKDKETQDLFGKNFSAITFAIGPVPVVLVPGVELKAGILGTFSVGFKAEQKESAVFGGYATWTPEDEWTTGNHGSKSSDPLKFVFTGARVQGRGFLEARADLMVYGVVGPFIGLQPYVELIGELTSTLAKLGVYLGLDFTIGIELGIENLFRGFKGLEPATKSLKTEQSWAIPIFRYPLFEGEWKLPQDAYTEPEPHVSIQRPTGTSTLGCCDVLLAASSMDMADPDARPKPVWTSSINGPLGTGHAGRVDLDPGTHTITATIDIDGYTASDSVTVTVGNTPPSPQPGDFYVVATAENDIRPAIEFAVAQEGLLTGYDVIEMAGNGAAGFALNAPQFPTGSTGLILSNGLATSAHARNNSDSTSHDWGDFGSYDSRGVNAGDVTTLALEINVPRHTNCLRFDYQLLSEEYPKVGAREDAFVAELDSTTWKATGEGSFSAPLNFATDADGKTLTTTSSYPFNMHRDFAHGTTFNGATRVLRAATPVTPGPHTLYLSILDYYTLDIDTAVIIDNLKTTYTSSQLCN